MMHKHSVLIVEDEAVIAESFNRSLLDLGYEVLGIEHKAKRVMHILSQRLPDIILLDINLEGENGFDVSQEIQRQYNIPVVFITAYADSNTISQTLKTNPYGYLIKPVSGNDIHAAIQIALNQFREQQKRHVIVRESVSTQKESVSFEVNIEYQTILQNLSPKEIQVLQFIGKGHTDEEIAEQLYISRHTVKTHRRNISNKTNIHTINKLMLFAIESGVLLAQN